MKILSIQNYNHKNTQNPNTVQICKQPNFGTLHFSDEMIDVFKRKNVNPNNLLTIKSNTKDLSKHIFDSWLKVLTRTTYNTDFSSKHMGFLENVVNSAYYSIAERLGVVEPGFRVKQYVETEQIKGICEEYSEKMNNSLQEVFQKNGEDFDIDVFTHRVSHSPMPGDDSIWTDFVIFDVPGLGYTSKRYADNLIHRKHDDRLINAIVDDLPAGKFGSLEVTEKEPNSKLVIELNNTLKQINNEARAKFENIFKEQMTKEVETYETYDLLK